MTEQTLSVSKCPNPKCGAVIIKRVLKPVKCPRCGTRYIYPEDEQKSEQTKEVKEQ